MTQVSRHPISRLNPAKRQRVTARFAASELASEDRRTLREILTSKCDFMPSELFAKRNAEKKVLDEAPTIARPDTSWYHPVMESGGDPKRTKTNHGTALLTATEERVLFLQFNYCRYRVARQRKKLRVSVTEDTIAPNAAHELLHWYRKADKYRKQIANTNLALVLAMAKRTRMTDVEFGELVSEGNMALLRAVDKFDVGRGFKFSTYACRAILKAFSRCGVKQSRYRQLFPTDFDPNLERSDYMERKRRGHEEDCVDEVSQIIETNTAELSEIEQSVIEHRFAVGAKQMADPEAGPLTLEEVGHIIGVTKERVRQIQNKALEKIRLTLEDTYLA